RREPAREPRAPQARAREGGARRPRLRGSGGREACRGAGTRASADAPPRALGAARPRRGRRPRGARVRADAAGGGLAARCGMTRYDSPRIVAYAGLAAFALLVGLALGRVELVALAAPFALAAVVGAALGRDPAVTARIELEQDRALEGDDVPLRLQVAGAAERVDLVLPLPGRLQLSGGNVRGIVLGAARELELHCRGWGAFAVGPVLLRASDRLGFHFWEAHGSGGQPLRVYPSVETMR